MGRGPALRCARACSKSHLLHVLVKRNGYVDPTIVDDVANGMPIAGDIDPPGALRPRVKEAETTLEDRPMGIAERNKQVIERTERLRASALGPECWAQTRREIDDVWLTPPV